MHGPLGWGRAELIILQVVTQTEACLPDKEVSESHEHEHGYWVAGDSESHLQQKAELVTALQGLGQRRIHTAQQRREEESGENNLSGLYREELLGEGSPKDSV